MQEPTERGLEIVRLHDTEKLSFRAIGECFAISKGRASYIYHEVLRYQREKRQSEFYKIENTKMISFALTLGEAVVLQRILDEYMLFERNRIPHAITNSDLKALETECIDYISASELSRRLRDTERENRTPFHDLDTNPVVEVRQKEPCIQ